MSSTDSRATPQTRRVGAKATELWIRIGDAVRGVDGERLGTVDAVVLVPTSWRLTHVSMSPGGTYTESRLVPLPELASGDGSLHLVHAHRWPGGYPATYEVGAAPPDGPQAYHLPYPYAADDLLVRDTFEEPFGLGLVLRERLPKGAEALYAGTPVTAQDGQRIGVLAAFLVHAETQAISHVLLRHGHLRGRRTVLLPIDLVAGVEHHAVVFRGTRNDLDRYAVG